MHWTFSDALSPDAVVGAHTFTFETSIASPVLLEEQDRLWLTKFA